MYRYTDDVAYLSTDAWRRANVTSVLEDAGYRVRAYASAMELMRAVARHSASADTCLANVLLVDGTLDDTMHAPDVLAVLRRAQLPMRSVVLARFDAGEEIIRCLRLGAADFIHVPVPPAEIVRVVRRVIQLPAIA